MLERAEIRVEYATVRQRLAAFYLDLLLLVSLAIAVDAVTSSNRATAIVWLIVGVYFVGLAIEGGTLGKRMLGLRVVRRDNGKPIGFLRAVLRETVGRIISIVPIGLGLFWAARQPDRQAWHDLMAGTVVVREYSPQPEPAWATDAPWLRSSDAGEAPAGQLSQRP